MARDVRKQNVKILFTKSILCIFLVCFFPFNLQKVKKKRGKQEKLNSSVYLNDQLDLSEQEVDNRTK